MQKSLECCDDTQSLAYARQTLQNLLLEETSDVITGQGQQPQAQQKIVAVQKVSSNLNQRAAMSAAVSDTCGLQYFCVLVYAYMYMYMYADGACVSFAGSI